MCILKDKAPQLSPHAMTTQEPWDRPVLFEEPKEGNYGQSINLNGRRAEDAATFTQSQGGLVGKIEYS